MRLGWVGLISTFRLIGILIPYLDYITFLEGNFLRVIRAIFPNVKEFDPAHVAPAVLFIEQEQGAAPESTTPWYKNWLTWVVIAILLGFATCSYFLGDQG